MKEEKCLCDGYPIVVLITDWKVVRGSKLVYLRDSLNSSIPCESPRAQFVDVFQVKMSRNSPLKSIVFPWVV